jgi:hypothetical protein
VLGCGLEARRAAVFAVIYSKLSASGFGDPQKSWSNGAWADGKNSRITAKEQQTVHPRSAQQT